MMDTRPPPPPRRDSLLTLTRLLATLLLATALLALLAITPTHAVECDAKNQMVLRFMNSSTLAGNPATCQDGTQPGYYIDPPADGTPAPYKFIVFLGDGDVCTATGCDSFCNLDTNAVGGICEGVSSSFDDLIDSKGNPDPKVVTCFLARLQCSSNLYNATTKLTPQTILCRQTPGLAGFVRVFVPICTLDWWMGRGHNYDATSKKFRGAYVLDALLEELDYLYGISVSPLLVLAGTRGGGVGVLNNIKAVKQKFPGATVVGLVDSAWFVDSEGFSIASSRAEQVYVVDNYLRTNTAEWILNARVDEACDAFWNVGGPSVAQRHRCMFSPELLENFMVSERILTLHSEYDLVFLSQMGLLDPTAPSRFIDASSFATAAISYVDAWGSTIRSSTLNAALGAYGGAEKHCFVTTACGLHGYLIPTSVHKIDPTREAIGSAGTIQVERDQKVWENILVGNLTIQDAVLSWIQSSGLTCPSEPGESLEVEGLKTDACRGFLCNPTCLEQIFPFRLSYVLNRCARIVVLLYAFVLMCTLWLSFAWAYWRVRYFRGRNRRYWNAIRTGKPLPNLGISKARIAAAQTAASATVTEGKKVAGGLVAAVDLDFVPAAASITTPVAQQEMAAATASVPTPAPVAAPSRAPAPARVVNNDEPPEEDSIDLVALAEALSSKDKAVRKAAKLAYKEHQKKAAERRKQMAKTQEQQAYEAAEREAQAIYEQRMAQIGRPTEPEKEKEGKKDKKAGKGEGEKESPAQPPPTMRAAAAAMGGSMHLIQKRAEDELISEVTAMDYRKVHLMVRDLSYWAPPRKRKGLISRLLRRGRGGGGGGEDNSLAGTSKFQILRNVNIVASPGQVHALMGPSGSGKSTLLDVLALIRDSGEMSGRHYINGVHSHAPQAAFLRDWLGHNVSYVKQTDVLFPRMTVREHLTHAAWLLLPQFMSDLAKLRRVSQVIELLELDGCADTICGDGGVKIEGGISGGQRRRVSVATQLLRLPAAMLLDEPTSGLDSTSALLLVKALHTLAHRGGLTIVMTIHQPRNEIFALFDQLTILVAGEVVFSGSPFDSPAHFRLENVEQNVANDILDKLAVASKSEVAAFKAAHDSSPQLGKRILESMRAEITDFDAKMADDLQQVLAEAALGEGRWSWSNNASSALQMWVLMSRTMRRGGFDLRKTMTLAALGGVVVGLCFLGIGTFTSRTALCYLGVSTMTFLQGAFLGDRYLAEKEMYDHESSAGSAVSWHAFLASQFVRDSVTSSCEAILFAFPVYWIGGMSPHVDQFLLYLLMVVLIAHVCISQNVAVEVDRDNLRAAALVNVGYVGLGALFNGFIIRLNDLPIFLSWLPYIMVTYWGFAGIIINDFQGEGFGCKSNVLECATRTGDVIIVSLSFDRIDSYISILVLVGLIFCFRGFTVFNFYMRYVRGKGKGLKIVSGGSVASVEDDLGGNISGKVGSAMKAMLTYKGTAGKDMVKNARELEKKATEQVGATIQYNDEWEAANEENAEANTFSVATEYSRAVSILLSRPLMIFVTLLDVAWLGLVCAVNVGDPIAFYVFLTGNALVAIYFGVQAIVAVTKMVPITPTGPKDCTWSGLKDIGTFVFTVADIVIVIQLFSSTAFSSSTVANQDDVATQNGADLFLILAGITRLFRIVRVVLFWNKVASYHQIRADSWLLFAEARKYEKGAVKVTAGAIYTPRFNPPPPPGLGAGGSMPPIIPARASEMATSLAKSARIASMNVGAKFGSYFGGGAAASSASSSTSAGFDAPAVKPSKPPTISPDDF